MTKEFNLKEKRKEAFDWAECMDESGQSIDEIIEDLKDKIEKQDKEFIKLLEEKIVHIEEITRARAISEINKLSGFKDE